MSIDRSTGLRETTPLGRHARRFLLASITVLVAACSSLKLGYNNAETLLVYSLDSYFDLDDKQQELARERVRSLLTWHRGTQLEGYARLLAEAQRRVDGTVTASDVATFQQQMNAKLAAIGDQAAPDLAALALSLRSNQIDRCADKLARDSARRELVSLAGGRESIDERVKRYADRAQSWFGSLTSEQVQVVRASLAARSATEQWWMAEREQRQRDLVAVLRRIHDQRPTPAVATHWLRDNLAQLTEPHDPARRAALAEYRRSNAELIARLINSAEPRQRATLAKRLSGYAEDFVALAAPATTGS